jgi:hypothetical protein
MVKERESERQKVEGVVVRDYNSGEGGSKQYFRFEGSQALPASPSDKG